MGASGGVPSVVLNPPIIEVDDQQDTFFSPRDASAYDAFGPRANDMEIKVKAIEEKLREMEGSDAFGLNAVEMCLVPIVVIPAKFRIPDFEKYKGANDLRTHIQTYYCKMAAYSDNGQLLVHFFQDSLSGASLDWYMQLEVTHIRT